MQILCVVSRKKLQLLGTSSPRLPTRAPPLDPGTDAITFPVMELPYLAKHYRIKLSRSRMAFQLIDTKFGANLSWTNGVQLTNAVLEMSVPLPPKIFVPFWKVAKLRSLLQVPHFAAIRILSDNTNRYLDVLVCANRNKICRPHRQRQLLCRSIRCCL